MKLTTVLSVFVHLLLIPNSLVFLFISQLIYINIANLEFFESTCSKHMHIVCVCVYVCMFVCVRACVCVCVVYVYILCVVVIYNMVCHDIIITFKLHSCWRMCTNDISCNYYLIMNPPSS